MPRWLSTISYPTCTHGIIDKYKMIYKYYYNISVISSIIITALLFFMPSTWAMAAKVWLWLANVSMKIDF